MTKQTIDLSGKAIEVEVEKEPIKHIVMDKSLVLHGWYKDKTVGPGVRPRTCYTEALLLAPYGGFCPVGCRYCYLNLGFRGYGATGMSTVDPNYVTDVTKAMQEIMVAGAAYITPYAEPFHNLEARYHHVENLAKLFNTLNLPIFYTTKREPPMWAARSLLPNPYSYIHFSINAPASSYRRFNPGAADYHDLLGCVAELSQLGVYVGIQCNPLHPGLVDLNEYLSMLHDFNSAGAQHVIFKFVEENYAARSKLMKNLKAAHFDEQKLAEFDHLFSQKIGGVYTVEQELRLSWLAEFLSETRKMGMTMATCHEYVEQDGDTFQLGPSVTTADQCHGRGVPIHYRQSADEQFKPLPGCYRKGCLYCHEYGTHACQNETLLAATALEFKDMKKLRITPAAIDPANWEMLESCEMPDEQRPVAHNPEFKTDIELWGV